MRNRLSIWIFVIFSMLFAQAGGLAHGYAHVLTEHFHSGDQLPADNGSCDTCDTYAQITSAIGSSTLSFAPPQRFIHAEQNIVYPFSSVEFFPFSARAPPKFA